MLVDCLVLFSSLECVSRKPKEPLAFRARRLFETFFHWLATHTIAKVDDQRIAKVYDRSMPTDDNQSMARSDSGMPIAGGGCRGCLLRCLTLLPETRNPKPEIRNPEPETGNPKSEILNPTP